MELKTERLLLDCFTDSDADLVEQLEGDKRVVESHFRLLYLLIRKPILPAHVVGDFILIGWSELAT